MKPKYQLRKSISELNDVTLECNGSYKRYWDKIHDYQDDKEVRIFPKYPFPNKIDSYRSHISWKHQTLPKFTVQFNDYLNLIKDYLLFKLGNVKLSKVKFYKVLIRFNKLSDIDTKGLVVNSSASNPYRELKNESKLLTQLTGKGLIFSSIETVVNVPRLVASLSFLNIHEHGLLLTSMNTDELSRLIENHYPNSRVSIEPFISGATGEIMNLGNDTNKLFPALLNWFCYCNKQPNKLPERYSDNGDSYKGFREWKSVPNKIRGYILHSIYNASSKHGNVSGVRTHQHIQFKRVNNALIWEVHWFRGKLYRLIRNQLITREYELKRDGSVSTIRVTIPVPPLSNVWYEECFKNAISVGFIGTPTKNNNNKKEAELFQLLLNGGYVVYLNSS